MKRQVEIETLLRWAYQDELPKRQTSSAEGIWDRLAQNGSLGGIDPDPGHGAAQRYAHFGLPHPDAETIDAAVTALEDATIDWGAEGEAIMGPMLGIADMRPKARQRGTTIGYRDRHRDKLGWRTEAVMPVTRDVIMVRSLRTANLVMMHAAKGTRPQLIDETSRPYPKIAAHGPPRPQLIGECRGKHHYTTGSYCPLEWRPSPIMIAQDRADYLAWHRGLQLLARSLKLGAHQALAPVAPEMPWRDPPEAKPAPRRVFPIGKRTRVPLPLKPQRPYAGPPRRQYSVTKKNEPAESA